jgi:membrane glycosyltransferase
MQYRPLVTLPNLTPVSRYQLVLAILMFIGSPAWVGLLVLATAALALCDDPANIMRSDAGSALLIGVLVMWFSPKIAGALDVLLDESERRAFGGGGRFTVNFAIETVYSIVLCPILWISHTIFLFGRLFDRDINWMGQVRDDHVVPFALAMRDLWPQTLVGCLSLGLVAFSQPWALPYLLLLAGGPAFAAPFATVTAWPVLGSLAARIGIGRLPEETTTPEDLLELALPAITRESRPPLTSSV